MSEQTARERARAARQAAADAEAETQVPADAEAETGPPQRPRNGTITQAQLEAVLQPGDPPWWTEADRPKKARK